MEPGLRMTEARPYSKEQQLARGTKRHHRKVASTRRMLQIIDAKLGPCRVCGYEGHVELHHLVPRSQSGSDTEANLVPLCKPCHERVTANDKAACAMLRRNLTDAEYAYAVDKLGEGRFESRYPVEYRRA